MIDSSFHSRSAVMVAIALSISVDLLRVKFFDGFVSFKQRLGSTDSVLQG